MARGDRFRNAAGNEQGGHEPGFLANPKLMADDGADASAAPEEKAPSAPRRGRPASGVRKYTKTVYLSQEAIEMVEAHVGFGKEFRNFSEALGTAIEEAFGPNSRRR